MFCALFAAAIFAFAPGTDAPGSTATVLVARIAPTRLIAVNPSERAQLLVFRDASGNALAKFVLPAHAGVDHTLPAGTLESLTLEVVSRSGLVLQRTGELSLREIAAERFDALWIEASANHADAWGERRGGFARVAPLNEPALDVLDHETCDSPDLDAVFSAHVPVITPSDKSKGDLPPRLETKPLPPV